MQCKLCNTMRPLPALPSKAGQEYRTHAASLEGTSQRRPGGKPEARPTENGHVIGGDRIHLGANARRGANLARVSARAETRKTNAHTIGYKKLVTAPMHGKAKCTVPPPYSPMTLKSPPSVVEKDVQTKGRMKKATKNGLSLIHI